MKTWQFAAGAVAGLVVGRLGAPLLPSTLVLAGLWLVGVSWRPDPDRLSREQIDRARRDTRRGTR